MEPFRSVAFSLSLFLFGNLFFCTRRRCKTKTDKDWNMMVQSQSLLWRGMDYNSLFLSLTPSLCLHLFAFLSPPPFLSVSHPLSGLTPDELVPQALSLRLFELHKKQGVIGEGWTAKEKKKKRNASWKKNVWEIPNIFFDHAVTKSCMKVCGVESSKTEGKQ